VNRLIKQFDQTRKMMKMVTGSQHAPDDAAMMPQDETIVQGAAPVAARIL
jgi:signal recognition particle GTPase